ncbi:MAG: glycosyltransferase [Simkaniaceae bacterium]|nr:glycosyltransferase [Candidatus Sacchlamyda saccharinae]
MMRWLSLLILFCWSSCFAAPSVSIITPLYKGGDHIQGFIEDITKQTIFEDCELLIIDANSPENIRKQLAPYLQKFSNIRLRTLPYETTLYEALNMGIEEARGTFIYFAAVDNRVDPAALEKMVLELVESPQVDCVYADFFVTTNPNETFEDNSHQWVTTLPEYHPSALNCCLTGPQPLWRKEVHDTIGYFREDFIASGNWEFWNRVAKSGGKFKRIPKVLTLYYWNPNGVTTTSDPEITRKRDKENDWIIQTYSPFWEQNRLEEKPFVIVIPSFNNKQFYKQNLDSVFSQKYQNFRVIYVDDASPDGTGDYVADYVRDRQYGEKVSLVRNPDRVGSLANLYKAIHSCKPDEIVITLDGDDWFAHDEVLKRLNCEYENPNVWLTYGQYAWYLGGNSPLIPGHCEELPEEVVIGNSIREYKWVTSQLRTFYAGLFQQIDVKDLLYQGNFFQMTADVAIMMPMVEMAGWHHSFVPDLLYIYNRTSSINDDKISRDYQLGMDLEIRSRAKYQPVATYNLQELQKHIYISKGQWGDLFAKGDPLYDRDDSLAPLIALRDTLAEQDYHLHQVDSFKGIVDPHALICFEVPTEEELRDLLEYPYESRILFLWEPISTAPSNYAKDVHQFFHKIYTWDDSLVDNEKYFKFYYPRLSQMIEDLVPFDQKNLCCAISCNKGSAHPDELYSERKKLYHFFDQNCPGEFSLFGRGWTHTEYSCYQGLVDKKVDTIKNYKFCVCYENIKGVTGYVTEKIFDVFQAGAVPIYLGAPNIGDYVPENCYIDRSRFENDQMLYDYLVAMTEEEYQSYIENIQYFLRSTKASLYSIEAFVRKISADLLEEKTPYYFCTGANADYFYPLLNLIGSIHKHHFDSLGEVAVFDLGLKADQLSFLKTVEKVAVYPVEMIHKDLLKPFRTTYWGKQVPGWYAWKPVCLKQGLELFPDFLWIDAGTTLFLPIDPLFNYLREHGYFFHNGSDWNFNRMVTDYVIERFQLDSPQNGWILDETAYGVESGLMGITPKIKEAFVLPAYEVSCDLKAFIDNGSAPGGFGTARHDQTIFSVFAMQNDYKIFHHFDSPKQSFPLDIHDQSHLFHISCCDIDCKEETHIYCSRKDFDLTKTYPHIRFKNENTSTPASSPHIVDRNDP